MCWPFARPFPKCRFYVWNLGWRETADFPGIVSIRVPTLLHMLHHKCHHLPFDRATVRIDRKGLTIKQTLPIVSKVGKLTAKQLKTVIRTDSITFSAVGPPPFEDTVCIGAMRLPDGPVQVHCFRCDRPQVAAILDANLQLLMAAQKDMMEVGMRSRADVREAIYERVSSQHELYSDRRTLATGMHKMHRRSLQLHQEDKFARVESPSTVQSELWLHRKNRHSITELPVDYQHNDEKIDLDDHNRCRLRRFDDTLLAPKMAVQTAINKVPQLGSRPPVPIFPKRVGPGGNQAKQMHQMKT